MLVALGVAGLVLPVLQGFLLLAPGGWLLSKDAPLLGQGVGCFKACFSGLSLRGKHIRKHVWERR
jgi:hypothetical protein